MNNLKKYIYAHSLCEKHDEYQIDTVTRVARASDSHAYFAVALSVLVNSESAVCTINYLSSRSYW